MTRKHTEPLTNISTYAASWLMQAYCISQGTQLRKTKKTLWNSKAHLERSQIAFSKIVNGLKLLIIFGKSSTLDVCQGSKYAPEVIHL